MLLEFECETGEETRIVKAQINAFVIAGWTGRDRESMEHHIVELEKLGVARPKRTPTYYRVAASRLTTSNRIEDAGANASGEVEPVILAIGGRLYVGVGSDHTDRKVETYGVTVSKQMCDKPIASHIWEFDDVKDHWDQLVLRSWAMIDGEKVLYQDGSVARLQHPEFLISDYSEGAALPDGIVMFGGTLPAIGGVRVATAFEGQLVDPVLNRTLSFGYEIATLPIHG